VQASKHSLGLKGGGSFDCLHGDVSVKGSEGKVVLKGDADNLQVSLVNAELSGRYWVTQLLRQLLNVSAPIGLWGAAQVPKFGAEE
jgi:hypothetical protein